MAAAPGRILALAEFCDERADDQDTTADVLANMARASPTAAAIARRRGAMLRDCAAELRAYAELLQKQVDYQGRGRHGGRPQ